MATGSHEVGLEVTAVISDDGSCSFEESGAADDVSASQSLSSGTTEELALIPDETQGSLPSNEAWTPKGLDSGWKFPLSDQLEEVYENVAQERKGGGESPRPIVVITDMGYDYHDLAALVVLKELQRLTFVELRAVVATKLQPHGNVKPGGETWARFARAALHSLDLPNVPLACGQARHMPSTGRDDRDPLKHELEMLNLVKSVEGGSVVARDVSDLQDGQELLRKIYENAKVKGEKLFLLCLSSLPDLYDFWIAQPHLIADCTAEVHVLGGDWTWIGEAHEGRTDAWRAFIQTRGIQWHTYKGTTSYGVPLSLSTIDPSWEKMCKELEATGHPISAYPRSLEGKRAERMLCNVRATLGVAGPDVSKVEVFWSEERGEYSWIIVKCPEDAVVGLKQNQAMLSLLKVSLLELSKTLCNFCNSINFGAVGYHGEKVDELKGEFDNEPTHRPVREVLQNLNCIFCRKVAESFREWSRGKFDMQALDLQNDSNQAHYEMVRLPEKHGSSSSDNTLIRIQVMLKVFSPYRKAYRLLLEFQKCSLPLQTVQDEDLSCDKQAYSGRIRPLDANTSLFRNWIKRCKDDHHHCGKNTSRDETGQFMNLDGLRLIDVEEMCVVDVQGDLSYTALSYVWGQYKPEQKVVPQLTIENRVHFQQPGSLQRVVLPKTIADAIEVTKILDYRYIWIDCLCIVQGDETDARYFIPQMDVIFGCAVFTIVAAAGDNADAGLPGIRPNSRTRKQIPFPIRDVSLVRTLDPELSEERHSSFDGYLKESTWSMRGWTFQEKLISPRALIFTEHQVYWECQESSFCEDGLWEIAERSRGTIYRHCFGDKDYCLPWNDGVQRRYQKMVEEYSGRIFKYEKDRRDAFEGILQCFQWHARGRQVFLWALPRRFLSNSLMWHCKEISSKRRLEKCRVTSEWGQPIKDCPFPSWSWLGWMGKVCFNVSDGTLDAPTIDLNFYYFFGGKLLSANQIGATLSLFDMHVREDGNKTIVTLEDIPKSIDSVLIQEAYQSNILFFWSSTARLHVQHDGVDWDGNAKLITSHGVDANGKRKDIVKSWFHKPLFPSGHAELVEFVVIGMFIDHSKKGYSKKGRRKSRISLLAVLLIEWKNGVAYRQGLAHIQLSDWVELENRKWKLIFLG